MKGKKFLIAAVMTMTFGALASAPLANAEAGCCETACVCCPPPPVLVSWCVVDPCDPCCKHTVETCLPACCAGETPCLVGWRKGLFGRKILTYRFSCGECVDVLLTRRGARVR